MSGHDNPVAEPEPEPERERSVWKKAEKAFNSKQPSQYYDPCQEAANKSIRCVHRNPENKDLCSDYFQAYRDCKKQWLEERRKSKYAPS